MRERMKKDNRGSAIVTVMVVVAFLSVLITVLLYVSAMNYKTKQLEYQNAKSFYITETALEEIKSVLMVDVSKACQTAYETTIIQYANLSFDQRMLLYEQKFLSEMEALWNAKIGLATSDLQVLKENCGLTSDSSDCIYQVAGWSRNMMDVDGDGINDAVVVLEDVVVSYTTSDGYNTMIQTDIYIEAPGFNWSIDSSGSWTTGADNVRDNILIEDYVVFKNWTKYS